MRHVYVFRLFVTIHRDILRRNVMQQHQNRWDEKNEAISRLKQWEKEFSSRLRANKEGNRGRAIRVEDNNIRAREVEGGCTMGRIIPGETSVIIYETRHFFALHSIKTVDRSCSSRKCGNGMIHCRGRESVSLFSSRWFVKTERRDHIVKNLRFTRYSLSF